jgi:hypothetical protein
MLCLLSLTVLVNVITVRAVDFVYFCWLSGQLFYNALFHMGTTAYFGVYSPGLLSAILLYLPICYYVARAAHREGRIGDGTGAAALVIGAAAMLCLAYFALIRHALASE